MTTTYDPFIPADGTDQHRYDGRRRAQERETGPAWGAEPRWEPQYQQPQQPQFQEYAEPHRPAEQRWDSEPPRERWELEPPQQQRWEPEPTPHPRAWQTGTFPVAVEPEPERTRSRGVAPLGAARGKVKPLLAGLVAVLAVVAGWQAYRIESMSSSNASMQSVLAAERTRTDRLEKELAGVFDPEAVSSKVLPSVFRVRAGEFTGTAFSVGTKAANGQANLLTNYHVVAEVWTGGGKAVTLERGATKINATIVKVSKAKDLALLRANQEIAPLAASTAQVKPGQQVVVVGAPLGLDDTVTTGVISAYRPNDPDGPTIQFDAPINPGNSGGPVVNANNQVVGLATAKAKDAEGIGLAIPVKTACSTFSVC
ncbi:S1C family serine protease [Paractinoplanes globisporus]|uniref:S1C family serine protease n=1 Tax=Paractinoplanes globisporus TaxID=113565 RepID=A0ABW6WJW8_9ACTN|nr:S1C family serine protease [Actinoplanes globisporus]